MFNSCSFLRYLLFDLFGTHFKEIEEKNDYSNKKKEMRLALSFGATAVVVCVFAIRKRYDSHVSDAQMSLNRLRTRQIPQTLEEGEIASNGLASDYQEIVDWLDSSLINQIIHPPPPLKMTSQLPAVSEESGESEESEESNDENNENDEN